MPLAGHEVVDHADNMASTNEFFSYMRSDETRAASDEIGSHSVEVEKGELD
jgi:hypothetical protein